MPGYGDPPAFNMPQRAPMFGDAPPPHWQGALNIQQPEGMLGFAQLLGNQYIPHMLGPGRMPLQLLRQQSVYDQIYAQKMQADLSVVTAAASKASYAQFHNLSKGLLGDEGQMKKINEQIASTASSPQGQMLLQPLLAQLLGRHAEVVYGPQGSAPQMAAQLFNSFHTTADPLTGKMGYSGESTKALVQDLMRRREQHPGAFGDLYYSEVGQLAGAMSRRGLLGANAGNIPLHERMRYLPENLDDEKLTRIAYTTKIKHDGKTTTLRDMADENKEIPQELVDKTKEMVKETYKKLRTDKAGLQNSDLDKVIDDVVLDSGMTFKQAKAAGMDSTVTRTEAREKVRTKLMDGLTDEERKGFEKHVGKGGVEALEKKAQATTTLKDLEAMTGGEDIIRASDVDRIGNKLSDMSGALKAMREILGRDGSVEELLSHLDNMTQGGLARMTGGQIEHIARTLQATARQTGMSAQSQMGMIAQSTVLADRLGLDRSFTPSATTSAVAFASAAGQFGGTPRWGALDNEQLALSVNQLKLHAAASPAANQAGMLLRMRDAGMLKNLKPESETAAILKALEAKQTHYTFNNESREWHNANLDNLLPKDAGIPDGAIRVLSNDKLNNQEAIAKYGMQDVAFAAQADEFKSNLGTAIGNALSFATPAANTAKTKEAQEQNDQQKARVVAAGRAISKEFLDITNEEQNDPAVYKAKMEKMVVNAFTQQGYTPQQADELIKKQGGIETVIQVIEAGSSKYNATHRLTKSTAGARQLFGDQTRKAAIRAESSIQTEAHLRTALGPLVDDDGIKRAMTEITAAGERGEQVNFADVLAAAVSTKTLEQAGKDDKTGQIATINKLATKEYEQSPRGVAQTAEDMHVIAAIFNGENQKGNEASKWLQEFRKREQQLAEGKYNISTPEMKKRIEERFTEEFGDDNGEAGWTITKKLKKLKENNKDIYADEINALEQARGGKTAAIKLLGNDEAAIERAKQRAAEKEKKAKEAAEEKTKEKPKELDKEKETRKDEKTDKPLSQTQREPVKIVVTGTCTFDGKALTFTTPAINVNELSYV